MSNKNFSQGSSRYKVSSENSINTEHKILADIDDGKSTLTEFFEIRCALLNEFSMKGEFDFSPWPEERFHELVSSIKEFGVMQPIIVRENVTTTPGTYEILAGEHRWKASKTLGISSIPAKIIADCNDGQAKAIFTLTNMLSRELNLQDKIVGWSNYYQITKGRTQQTIEKLQASGILSAESGPDISRRYIAKYYRISTLIPELKKFVYNEKIPIFWADKLANFNVEEQQLLVPYIETISSNKKYKELCALQSGEIENQSFNAAGIDFVLNSSNDSSVISFSQVSKETKKILQAKINKSDYHNASHLVSDAIDIYYSLKNTLPDEVFSEVESDDSMLSKKALEDFLKSERFLNEFQEYKASFQQE